MKKSARNNIKGLCRNVKELLEDVDHDSEDDTGDIQAEQRKVLLKKIKDQLTRLSR